MDDTIGFALDHNLKLFSKAASEIHASVQMLEKAKLEIEAGNDAIYIINYLIGDLKKHLSDAGIDPDDGPKELVFE